MKLVDVLKHVHPSDQLPDEIDLSEIETELDRLWRETLPNGLEHGCCMELNADSTLSLTHEVVGSSDAITRLCHNVDNDHKNYKGFIHTHPLHKDGSEDVGFSYQDFAVTLEDGDQMAIVICDQFVYALVRNQATRPRCVIGYSEYLTYRQLSKDYMTRSGNGEFPVAVAQLRFNLDMCHRLGIAFYAGMRGRPLRRLFRP